jgi:hypothetical protein
VALSRQDAKTKTAEMEEALLALESNENFRVSLTATFISNFC